MGCTQSQPNFPVRKPRRSSISQTSHDEKIKKIYDYMTKEHEMSEQCVRNVAERMKTVMLDELTDTKKRLEEKIKSVQQGNALDLFMVNVSNDDGSITYEMFHRQMKKMHTEDCNMLLDRLKRIKLSGGNTESQYPSKGAQAVYAPDIAKGYR